MPPKPASKLGFARIARWLQKGRLAGLVILGLVLILRVIDPAPVELLSMRTFDLMQELFPRKSEEQPVAIVDIDDQSLAEIGQWPWPRTILAGLIDRLSEMGAVVIGFDVLFSEPDRTSPDRLAASVPGLDEGTRAALAQLPNNDHVFAEAVARSRVILGESAAERDLGGEKPYLRSPPATLGRSPIGALKPFPDLIASVPELSAAAAGRGLITIEPEFDGIVRRVPLLHAVRGVVIPALSFEMLHVATGESVTIRTGDAGIEEILVGKNLVPTDREGRVWVHFAHNERNIYISAKDVLSGKVDPARIADHFVLIGTSAIGLKDLKTTPLDGALPGVEVHAQLLETVLGGAYLERPDWANVAELLLIALIGLLMIVLVPVAGARWTLGILLLTGGGVTLGTGYLFVAHSWMLDGSLALITAIGLYIVLVYANYSREEEQRRKIRGLFGQYLSPAYVEELTRDPSKAKLGGDHRSMTFLFCDIRSFTAISERYRDDPGSLTRLINRYMTPMTDTIQAHRGTIDKYIGDCIMAFWNAPLDDPDHARNACFGALGMLAELAKFNAALTAEAEEGEARQRAEEAANGGTLTRRRVFTRSLAIGIGINTGDCIVGNMGSDQRLAYTVLGDAVNLASRLEGQSKNYGVTIVIGEDTERFVRDFATIELDLIAVKGRAEAVHIFTLLGGPAEAAGETYAAHRRLHDDMIAAYRTRQWDAARAAIATLLPLEPRLHALYDLYLARIATFERDPPPEDWRGIYVAETK